MGNLKMLSSEETSSSTFSTAKNGFNVSPAKSGISFEGISQLRTYSGEETSQNLSLFGEKFILAKNIPMESEPDTYSLNQKATELYTDSEMSDGGRETPV